MYTRKIESEILEALDRQAAVILLGPRQCGKTTMALDIANKKKGIYLDLEAESDRAKLQSPELYFEQYEDQLVVLDEIHKMPGLFEVLRGIIDKGRRNNKGKSRFLILGSASIDLLKQSGESLAGRVAYIDMGPLHVLEIENNRSALERLWLRGGFPDSYLASSDHESFMIRKDFVRSYLERDVPIFGPRVPSTSLERLWTMLAHKQGSILNASDYARMMEMSAQTINRYIDLLADLFLVRKLPSYTGNLGKRLVKSPKLYIRDSGLLHRLLNIASMDQLISNPIVGLSWEGFAIENITSNLPWHAEIFFYRTTNGAEQDIVLKFNDGKVWTVEVKLSLNTNSLSKGFYQSIEDLKPEKSFVVYHGDERYPIAENIEAIGLVGFIEEMKGKKG